MACRHDSLEPEMCFLFFFLRDIKPAVIAGNVLLLISFHNHHSAYCCTQASGSSAARHFLLLILSYLKIHLHAPELHALH